MMMGCPYSLSERSTVPRRDGDGACWHAGGGGASSASDALSTAAAAAAADFGCYGRVVNESASGPAAFSADQRRLIRDTWAKMAPQSTAIGKQVASSLLLLFLPQVVYRSPGLKTRS